MKGNNELAIEFLDQWQRSGPWVLTAIQIDKKAITTNTFRISERETLNGWLEEYNGIRNIYFHVNPTLRDMHSKATKEDMKSMKWLHVDIDPTAGHDLQEEQDRILALLTDGLPKGVPEPTVIIYSGGGYQAFWKLSDPLVIDGDTAKSEEAELYNKRLEQIFGGDHCHNVDRIMRLPGTINVPDIKKKKAGRVKQLAECLKFDIDKIYDLGQFRKAQEVQMGGGVSHQGGEYGESVKITGTVDRIIDLAELDEWNVSNRLKIVIAQGRDPDNTKEGDNSRSAWLFDCVCQLLRSSVPDKIIYSLITDPEWSIAQSVLENRNPQKYALRQMTRAKEYCEDPHLRNMNERHAIIGNIGGKCRVIEEIEDDVLGRTRYTLSSFEDLRNRYSHIQIETGNTKEGKVITMSLAKYWLNHPRRRQFNYMRFMPHGDRQGVYNLWRGFSVEPRDGDFSLFVEHLKENVCSGDMRYYNYLIRWMARAVQYPASPGEVAFVMRGSKGVGKSIVATIFGRLFGRHYLHIANPSHLVGNFNAHLRDVLVLFADEAFFAGDRKHESVLKMLVTEDSIPIEAKGVDVETYPNYVHLIMAANDPHVIRATGDERRYFVLEVGEGKKQHKGFFSKMWDQINNGGLEGLLFHLQNLDLTDFQVRDVPETEALHTQKLLSLGMDEEWWYRKLQDGRLLEHHINWEGDIVCDLLITDFVKYADRWKFNRRGNQTALGRFLFRICPHLKRTQKRVLVDVYEDDFAGPTQEKRRTYVYEFGSLARCRRAWEQLYGHTYWPDLEEGEASLE